MRESTPDVTEVSGARLHEANVDYAVRQGIEALVAERGLDLEVVLQPRAGPGRADVLVKTPLKHLLVVEDKVAAHDVFALAAQQQARAYANELGAEFFAVTNRANTILFQNQPGPISSLILRIWTDVPASEFHRVLGEVLDVVRGVTPVARPLHGFVEEYHQYFAHLRPLVQAQVTRELAANPAYQARFREKVTLMGLDPDPRTPEGLAQNRRVVAEQATYLFLNQVFFYELLVHYLDKRAVPHELMNITRVVADYGARLRQAYEQLVANFDFKPIFQNDCVFQIPFSSAIESLLARYARAVREYDLESFDHNVVAQIYQHVIPPEKRKAMGQIYTPAVVARLICRLAIPVENATILDPACGCGTFLKEAYERLAELKARRTRRIAPGPLHNEILSQLWGVEINTFPAHLATINLSFQQEPTLTDIVNVVVADFLQLKPLKRYTVKGWSVTRGEPVAATLPQKFDVIVGNPPYVRQELIPDVAKVRDSLERFAEYLTGQPRPPKSKKARVPCRFNKKVDYYAYFLWLGAYFLETGGTLTFIVSNKWLDVGYGTRVKEFLLDHFSLLAIIGFERNVFPDVDVSTVILHLRREASAKRRAHTHVKFLHVKQAMDVGRVVRMVREGLKRRERPTFTLNVVKQGALEARAKWSNHLLFVPLYEAIQASPNATRLGNGRVTEVQYGTKTAAVKFFFLDHETAAEAEIPARFLVPGVKSARHVPDTFTITPADVKHHYLHVPADTDLERYPGLKRHVTQGEERGFHARRSFKGTASYAEWRADPTQTPWYAYPTPCFPDILCKRHVHERAPFVLARAPVMISDGCKGVKVLKPGFTPLVFACLNSSVTRLSLEMEGRTEGAGDLQLMKNELENLVMLDPERLAPADREQLRALADRLLASPGPAEAAEITRVLDEFVLEHLGLGGRLNELHEAIALRTKLRTGRSHADPGLVS